MKVNKILVRFLALMQGSILPVTTPPGTPPGICNFFLTWRSIPHPRARRKRQFPTPGTPHRPQIRCFCVQNWFPYNSTTRRFDQNLNAFLKFTERRILHSIKKHGHYTEKENWRKKSNRTGIRLASKEMFFTACFILNIAYAQKRSGEQIDDSI